MKSNLIIIAILASFALVAAQNFRGFPDIKTDDIKFNADATFANVTEIVKNATAQFNNTRSFFNQTEHTLNMTKFLNETLPQLLNETIRMNNTINWNSTDGSFNISISSGNSTHSNSTSHHQNMTFSTFNGTHSYNNTSSMNATHFPANHTNWVGTHNGTHNRNHNRTTYNSTVYDQMYNNTGYYNNTLLQSNSSGGYSSYNSTYSYGKPQYNQSSSESSTNSSYGGPYSSYEYNYDMNDDFTGIFLLAGIFKLVITFSFFYIIAKYWKNRQERLRYLRQLQIPPVVQNQQYYPIQNQQFLQQGAPQPQQFAAYPQQQHLPIYINQGYPMQPAQQQQQQGQMFVNPIPQVQPLQPVAVNMPQQ